MNGTIPREHKEMCLRHTTIEDFSKEYMKVYGASFQSPKKLLNRINGMWYCRERFAKEIEDLKAADRVVMVPATIKNKVPTNSRADSLPDIGETLIKIQNLLAESVQLQKEQIALFQKLAKTEIKS